MFPANSSLKRDRLMREIRRQTRLVGAFHDGQAALMLVAARLRHAEVTANPDNGLR